MDKWNVLGIDKTKNKELIKNAYREKLKGVNPEDNQEGFMALRKAFEEAIYEADADVNDSENELEEGSIEYDLMELYNNFERRIDVSEWQQIFDRDEFISLDTAEESRNKVLVFLMNYNFVPQQVYKLVAETFNIIENKDEFREHFPEGFLNHIIDNAIYRDPISYYLFDSDGNLDDVDKYIDLYYGLDNAIRYRNIEEQARLISELEQIDLYHPYLDIIKLRHGLQKMNQTVNSAEERYEKYGEELKEYQKISEGILADVPDDYFILLFCGDISLINNDLDNTEIYYNKLSDMAPSDVSIKNRLGDLYCAKGEYEKARDLYMKLLDQNQYDDGARYGLVKANNGLIEQYNKILEEEQDNEEVKYKLVWCYYRNGLFDKCVEILTEFKATPENSCEYYDLLGRNYMYIKKYDEALESLFAWRDAILEIPEEDNSEKAVKNKNRYCYVNYYIGECYINLKNYDEARKYLEIATSKNHEFIEYAYDAFCKMEYELGNYDACLSYCQKLLDSSISYDAYLYTAKCFYQLDEYGNSIDACEMCIRTQHNFSEPYVLMLRMYWECEEYDHVDRVIKRFEQLGYANDDVDIVKARMAMRKNENEKAIELFKGVLDRKGTEEQSIEDVFDYLNVYTLIAACYERLDQEDVAITYLEKGLEAEPDDVFFLNRIANVCHVLGDFERSIDCCDRILEISEDESYRRRAYDAKCAALACLMRFEEAKKVCELNAEEYGLSRWFAIDYGELLVRMNDLDGCVKVMEEAIAQTEPDNSMIKPLIGNLCCFYGNEGYVDKAYEVFLDGEKRNPDDHQLYRSMGFVFLDHGRYEEAAKLLKKAYELDKNKSSYTCGLILQAISHFDDISKPEYKIYFDTANEQFKDINSGYAYIKYSEFLWATGRFEEAIEACNNALLEKRAKDTFFNEHYDAWHEMAVVYFNMGEYAKSKECYEKAQAIFGHNQLYIDNIAECEKKLNKQ